MIYKEEVAYQMEEGHKVSEHSNGHTDGPDPVVPLLPDTQVDDLTAGARAPGSAHPAASPGFPYLELPAAFRVRVLLVLFLGFNGRVVLLEVNPLYNFRSLPEGQTS